MPEPTPHVGDIGVVLELVLVENGEPVDLSSATTLEIILEDPKGTATTYPANLSTDGTDGALRYVTGTAAVLAEVGTYTYQARVVVGGFNGKSNVAAFDVAGNL